MKKNIIYLTILTSLFLVFKNYNLVLSSAIDATNIWMHKVFPYLFIMIIINDLLIDSNFESLFKNKNIYIFITSLISGTPTSAYITGKLLKRGTISKEYANASLIFTYFGNPLFLYTILNSIFKSTHITIKLMLISYLSNLILYIFYHHKEPTNKEYNEDPQINLAKSIKSAMNTNIMILGTICFYLILSNIFIKTFNINPTISIILRGSLEVTQGLNALINQEIIYKQILAIFFINFGGLSIHTQVKCILDEYKLNYKYFLKGRLIASIIAIFLTCIT